mmetsp:Transcript_17068/g.26118  ORF Transcript_17068/g.26118 Transcript_17068/m.26118 type:complete len:113 (-) Transcript_17068:563-901(-)
MSLPAERELTNKSCTKTILRIMTSIYRFQFYTRKFNLFTGHSNKMNCTKLHIRHWLQEADTTIEDIETQPYNQTHRHQSSMYSNQYNQFDIPKMDRYHSQSCAHQKTQSPMV